MQPIRRTESLFALFCRLAACITLIASTERFRLDQTLYAGERIWHDGSCYQLWRDHYVDHGS